MDVRYEVLVAIGQIIAAAEDRGLETVTTLLLIFYI